MIDKLDVRVLCNSPFTASFNELYTLLRRDPTKDPFHPTRHYTLSADLRDYGCDAILHLGCRRGKLGHNKIELADTGTKTFAGIVHEIEAMFQVDGLGLEVMRLDLAADIEGIPVRWFQERIKANHKQFIAGFGSGDFVEMGKGGIKTLYFGKRPNLVRIYDKAEEYRVQYAQLKRTWNSPDPLPSFESLYGIPESGYTLTRIERQLGGGKIPEEFQTVGDLRKLGSYHPFEKLIVVDGGLSEPSPEDYTFMEYCAGMYLRGMVETQGMHATEQFIKNYSNRNSKWAREKFRDFLPESYSEKTVDTAYLNRKFQNSVSRQLAA